MRDITDLPHDLFLFVISYLPPRTCILCRSVSRQWFGAFTNDATSQLLLRWNFPKCREMRLAAACSSIAPNNTQVEITNFAIHRDQQGAWATIFADVARRYYNLHHARPAAVEKLEAADPSLSFYGVATWNRFLRLDERTANFHYPDPSWWYSQDDGVLVYPKGGKRDDDPAGCDGYMYHVLDLSTDDRVPVPFDVRQKHIRRVRLAEGVLVFEWAEALPYHQLNDREVVHRHFVTAYDVTRVLSPKDTCGWTWTVTFRSEWKLHFLGLPLNRSDRFYSAHTSSHYAVYLWQPNRSLYQDDPIEQLAVWDITSPGSYRPSEDPKGDKRPSPTRAQTTPTGLWSGLNGTPTTHTSVASESDLSAPSDRLAKATAGPQVIRRMAWRELDFYGLRQRANPQLRNLALDSRNLYFIEEEHRWADGQHSALVPPRVHAVRCTGIPIVPDPPSSSPLATLLSGPVQGPIWLDQCGADGDVNMSFCRRTAPSVITDLLNLHVTDSPPTDDIRAMVNARPTPSASWPWALGRERRHFAPCWRHEDFPYLTVTEMLDAEAGVRVTARHCFMLETLSVHVQPGVISVAGTLEEEEVKKKLKRKSGEKEVVATRSGEAQFKDGMWTELMAKGVIFGDERWLLGEDEAGRITIVRF
ncbi:hypothetical protein OQA88_3675 [Cercophora sp. LCS_1]